MSDLSVNDTALRVAGDALTSACRLMVTENEGRPGEGLASLTGIAEEVSLHLRGLQVARAALADAAKGGAQATADLMESGDALDREIAASLYRGYRVDR